MNHYEELGVSPSATTVEIRQAYKSLVRVLHPDQQQDENLRRLSALQLRRLNDLFQILSDPEQRRAYDLSLQRYLPVVRHNGTPETEAPKEVAWSDIGRVRLRLRIPPGVMVWLLIGTIALGSAIVWLRSPAPPEAWSLARERSQALDSTGVKTAPEEGHSAISDASARPDDPVNDPRKKSEAQSAPVPREDVPAPERKYDPRKQEGKTRTAGPAADPAFIGAAQAAISKSGQPANTQETGPRAAVVETAAAVPPNIAETPDPPAILKPVSTSISGKWLYVPTSEDGKKTLYAPEYIELRINNRAGQVRGRYYGKYRVSDRAISSEINFQFEGRQGDTVSVLPWAGNNGSKGELRLKRLSAESLEVNWITTTFGQSNTLASGTAVLYRSDP